MELEEPLMTRMADCHPDRKHEAHGLCHTCYVRKLRAANPEKGRESGRKWYAANSEKHKERGRKWREANPEKKRENNRKWHAANPGKSRENARKWNEANPERKRETNRKRLLRRFDLTPEQFLSMEKAQGGVCAICLKPPKKKRLCVDHCHATGKVRGLLCHGCNASLGMLREDPDTIQRLLAYAILN